MSVNPAYNKDSSELLIKFKSLINNIQFSYLNVLNVGWEGGTVNVKNQDGETISLNISRAGGMAVVVSELPCALIEYGRASKIKVRVNSVSPYIGGAMRENSLSSLIKMGYMKKITTVECFYSEEAYDVDVYEGQTDCGKQYLLKSETWAGKFGGSMSPYILTLVGEEEREKIERNFVSNTPHSINLMEERAYVVFSQAVAKLYAITKSNVAILHDYHSALSLFYNDDICPVIIGHNMAYQGIMGINTKNLSSRKKNNNNAIATTDLAKRLNLSEQIVEKYFKAWVSKNYIGTGNILQATIRKSKEKTGISATTVSPGYVNELMESLDDLKRRVIENAHSFIPEDHFDVERTKERIKDFYLKHFDIDITDSEAERFILAEESRGLEELRTGNIIGILNGLDTRKHASKNSMLKNIVLNPYDFEWINLQTPSYLKNVIAKTPYFSKGLNFDATDPERVFKCKKVLRRILLMEFFPEKKDSHIWDNDKSFIHYSWGRLVDQKNIPLIIAEAENITKKGDILIIIAANPDDRLSGEIEYYAQVKSEAMRNAGLKFAFSSKFDVKGSLYAAGADLVHVPSRYEPCGLTDMESYWMGTPVVANMVGGLGKGGYAVAGFKADPTSLEAMCLAYRSVYNRAVNIKKYFPDQWKQLCLEALNLDFSYKKTANDYIDVIYVSMTKDIMNMAVEIAEAYDDGLVDQKIMTELINIMSGLPERLKKVYWKTYNLFPAKYGSRSFFPEAKRETMNLLYGF